MFKMILERGWRFFLFIDGYISLFLSPVNYTEFSDAFKALASDFATSAKNSAASLAAAADDVPPLVSNFISKYSDVPALYVAENLKTPVRVVNRSYQIVRELINNADIIIETYKETFFDIAAFNVSFRSHLASLVGSLAGLSVSSPDEVEGLRPSFYSVDDNLYTLKPVSDWEGTGFTPAPYADRFPFPVNLPKPVEPSASNSQIVAPVVFAPSSNWGGLDVPSIGQIYFIEGTRLYYFSNIKHDYISLIGGRLPFGNSYPPMSSSSWYAGGDVFPSSILSGLGLPPGSYSSAVVSGEFVDNSSRVSGFAISLVKGFSIWQEYTYDYTRDVITGATSRAGLWNCPIFTPDYYANTQFEYSYTTWFWLMIGGGYVHRITYLSRYIDLHFIGGADIDIDVLPAVRLPLEFYGGQNYVKGFSELS